MADGLSPKSRHFRSSGASIDTRAVYKRNASGRVLHRSRDGFQRLVSDFVTKDRLFRLIESDDDVSHVIDLLL